MTGSSLRVLHLDDGRDWRGGQQQVALLVREQIRAGHRPILLCPRGAPLADRVREMGAECRLFDLSAGWWSRLVNGRRALVQLVERHRPDVVHAHTSHTHLLVQLLSRRRPRPLRVVTRRLGWISGSAPSRLKYARGIDLFVAVSEAVRRALIASGAPVARVAVAHSAIDPSRFEAPPPRGEVLASLGIPLPARVIGSLGSLVPQKAHLDLVEAFARLARQDPGLHLLIVGDGPLRSRLEASARRHGLEDRVHLPGFRSDLGRLVPHMDVMAFPSLFEGMPNAVLDALAAGVPVVATPAGGTGEVIGDQVGGVLVPFHSPRRLAEAVAGLLADPDRGRRLAAAGRARVLERHVPAVMAARTEEAYRQALAARASPSRSRPVPPRVGGRLEVWASDPAVASAMAARAGEPGELSPEDQQTAQGMVGPTGRGPIWTARLAGRAAVIKLHRRGGLPGRLLALLPRRMPELWCGTRRVRREARVAGNGRARGAPVPEAMAWLAVRVGPFRRLYAASAQVLGAVPLDRALRSPEGPGRPHLVRAAARAAARLHDAGLVHGDLNLGNLLWLPGEGRVQIVDLASARVRPRLGAGRRGADLARLERSALKILGAAAMPGRERLRFVVAYQRERAWLEPLPDPRRSTRALVTALRWRRALFPLHGVRR